jgi:hypothetical protein
MFKTTILAIMALMTASLCALSGFGLSGPVSLDNVPPTLVLISPNGGEIWPAGSTHNILWTATDSHFDTDPIDISWAMDGGGFTYILEDTANTGTTPWTLPMVSTNMALVKIFARDHFGNTAQRQSAAYFSISGAFPQAPNGVSVAIANETDAIVSWQAVTQYVDGSPCVPYGYLVFYSPQADTVPMEFEFLGNATGLSFTDTNAVINGSTRFYCVVAYSGPLGSLNAAIQGSQNKHGRKLTLKDLSGALNPVTGDGK